MRLKTPKKTWYFFSILDMITSTWTVIYSSDVEVYLKNGYILEVVQMELI